MINYWYLSRINEYPGSDVMSVQLTYYGSIIEMEREAHECELFECDLIYLGRGQWHDEHIQKNYKRYKREVRQ